MDPRLTEMKKCHVEWVTGSLRGCIHIIDVYRPVVGEVVKPIGGGKYRVMVIIPEPDGYEPPKFEDLDLDMEF